MLRKLLLICGLLSFSSIATAQWIGGVGYFDLTADVDGYEVSPDVYGFSVGYKFDTLLPDLSIVPGMSLYMDADDDIVDVTSATPQGQTTTRVRVETNFGMGFNVRFQWDGDAGLYFYLAPSLARFDIDGRAPIIVDGEDIGRAKVNDDEWYAGGALGIGYNATDRISFEFSFEEYGDADILGLNFRYAF
ncbi:MAG: autotransporter outer membrane beta-barrel domain-containing protein [Gammaproteobacteria bacterium]|nr:autotransporter outer membrane beta-barrel domain-containing protein [Gammaproteobacteria bacterium]